MTDLEARLARIESRLVQLMLHTGLNPYKKTYDTANPAVPRPFRARTGKRLPNRW